MSPSKRGEHSSKIAVYLVWISIGGLFIYWLYQVSLLAAYWAAEFFLLAAIVVWSISIAPKTPRFQADLDNSLKVFQILALIAAGMWAVFDSFGLKPRAEAQYSVSANSELRIELLQKVDEHTAFYCVTYTTWLHNESGRISYFSYYCTNVYTGKALEGVQTGFINPPGSASVRPMIKWALFAQYDLTSSQFAGDAKHWLDLRKPENPIEGKTDFEFGLPAKQTYPFETRYVILASEDDWVGVEHVIAVDQGNSHKDIIPGYCVDSIAIAMSKTAKVEQRIANWDH